MPTVHYYGRTNKFVGKTLFEILANLRNFGINRMLIRHQEITENPGKKSYYIVKKVEPVMDPDLKEGAIYAEQIYCGARVPGLVMVDEESWYNDWRLVPKHEEEKYILKQDEYLEHGQPETVHVLPRWMQVPPLLDVHLRRHYKARGGVQIAPVKMTDPIQIRMHYNFDRINLPFKQHRIAEEGEESPSLLNRPLQQLLLQQFRPGAEKSQEESEAVGAK